MKILFRSFYSVAICFLLAWLTSGCSRSKDEKEISKGDGMKIVFLHHSTGNAIWKGGVAKWFKKYNADHGTDYKIVEQVFPQKSPYGWKNYPFDYWNIWVKHAGEKPFMKEPTLEILTGQYSVIIWKHCFPVSDLREDTKSPDINSEQKTIETYKLQYLALREKMRKFPQNKFILWTGAAQVKNETNQGNAARARAFFNWVKNEWDRAGDNIFLWDFYQLETEGDLYLKDEYARGSHDSHPNAVFSKRVVRLLCNRIVNIIEGRGDSTSITGE